MSPKSYKIKAFTISEMILVLMITVIVVGLAFTILNLVKKQLWNAQINYEKKSEMNLLRQALWIDFLKYQNVNYQNQILRFEDEINTINYEFGKNWIVREKDTFYISLDTKKLYFDGFEITSGHTDAIELTTTKKEGNKTIFIYSENTAIEYMQ